MRFSVKNTKQQISDNNELSACFKKKLIETLEAFDTLCSENNITYYAAFGTAIGAIRHKGIIPWDDDIDVSMDFDNYRRFLNLKSKLNGTDYDIIHREDDGYQLTFAKFYNKNTTIYECINYHSIYGTFIDIIPFGYVPNIEYARRFKDKYAELSKSYSYSCQRYSFTFKDFIYIIKHPTRVLKAYYKRIGAQSYRAELDRMDNEIANNHTSDYFLCHCPGDTLEQSLYKPSWFKEAIKVPFENTEIPIPIGYHEYLTTYYGDYMTPPPPEQQIAKHPFCYMNLKKGLTFDQVKERIQEGERIVI